MFSSNVSSDKTALVVDQNFYEKCIREGISQEGQLASAIYKIVNQTREEVTFTICKDAEAACEGAKAGEIEIDVNEDTGFKLTVSRERFEKAFKSVKGPGKNQYFEFNSAIGPEPCVDISKVGAPVAFMPFGADDYMVVQDGFVTPSLDVMPASLFKSKDLDFPKIIEVGVAKRREVDNDLSM